MQKQTSPALEPTDCNCQALRQAARHVSQIYDDHLATVGLKTQQYSILSKLNRLGPQSINEMAKLMVMDRTTLGRAVRPLERDKLLTIEAGDDAQQRGLAAARGADDGQRLSPPDVERKVAQHVQALAVQREGFGEGTNLDLSAADGCVHSHDFASVRGRASPVT